MKEGIVLKNAPVKNPTPHRILWQVESEPGFGHIVAEKKDFPKANFKIFWEAGRSYYRWPMIAIQGNCRSFSVCLIILLTKIILHLVKEQLPWIWKKSFQSMGESLWGEILNCLLALLTPAIKIHFDRGTPTLLTFSRDSGLIHWFCKRRKKIWQKKRLYKQADRGQAFNALKRF